MLRVGMFRVGMGKISSAVAGVMILLAAPLATGRAQQSSQVPTVAGEYRPWGFDRSGIDSSTKPGDDFYRYVNGAWYDRTVIPPDRDSNGIDRVLSDAVELRVREILERGANGVEAGARADAAKIGALYTAFMNEARAETLDAQPIKPLIQQLRAAVSRDDLAGLMGASPTTFFSAIFSISIDVDAKAPDKYVVAIGQSGLGLPDRDYYLTPQFADKKAAYQAYIAQILELIDWEAPRQSAAAILAFETAIAGASWTVVEQRDSEKTYNPMSVAQLEQSAPFPWRKLLESANLRGLEHVVVAENTAVPKIADLFAQTPVETLKAWQAFHLADSAALYLSKRFVTAHFEFRGKTLGGVREIAERWKRGVSTVNGTMGEAIGRIYAARYFPVEAKAKVEALVEQLRLALKGRIERVAWMSQETKIKALEKLAQLNVKIAYPAKWRDYSMLEVRPDDLVGDLEAAGRFEWLRKVNRLTSPVDRDEWMMTPQTVNAYYNPNLNEIVFPAAQLQPPYFDPAADPAVNYGAIGAVIGHELTHAFDDDGRKYDGAGVLTDWWTAADAEEFRVRAEELGRQYDAFEPFPGAHVNGDLTMGENIADLGGLLIALDAYHGSLSGKPAAVIDGLTGDQRFFLGFAQSWRRKSTEDSVRQLLVSDPHAPEQFRVNGAVRNVDAWYDAFGVKPPEKLRLAPERRVRIW
jgi:putative endopeptidase